MKIYVFVLASLLVGCNTLNLEAPYVDPNKSREFATVQVLTEFGDHTRMGLLSLDGKPPRFVRMGLSATKEAGWTKKMHALPGLRIIRAECSIQTGYPRSRAIADLEVTLVAGETYTFDCTGLDEYSSTKMILTDSAGNDIRYRLIRSIRPDSL